MNAKILIERQKRCKVHFWRPGICRRYPQEELFAMGGTLSDDCGYKMEPIIPFKDVLKSIEKKHRKKLFVFKNYTFIQCNLLNILHT